MFDLGTLNADQLAAVTNTEGPLLVLAGAGSGKTRVITYRLAYLIREGVAADNILAVTFTNKAANEMRDRARKLVGRVVNGATISTFHALGVRILRRYGESIGLKPGFTICDAGEQMGSIRRILRKLRISDKKFDAKRIVSAISDAKNMGVDAASFREKDGVLPGADGLIGEYEDDYPVATIEAYERYESELRVQNVVDFDDLLLLSVRLLRDQPEVLSELQARFPYIMVDEYQDTNGAQFELLRRLAGERRNLCVVGDDDQSIYGWRGANVENILLFSEHFPGAKTVILGTNYRSTGAILSVADSIIRQNRRRYQKDLRSAQGDGRPCKLVAMDDEEVEAEEVANAILALTEDKTPRSDIAVLYRSNVQSRPVELALRRAHVRYRVVGGMELFDKKEVKDTLAYLRTLSNTDDEQSVRRIANFPPRGVSAGALKKVDDWGRQQDMSLFDALLRVDEVEGVSARAARGASTFCGLVREYQAQLVSERASVVARKFLEEVQLEDTLLDSSDTGVAASRRVDNVREIVNQLERFEERQIKKPKGGPVSYDGRSDLITFLAELALNGWSGSEPVRDEDSVVLSTIHAAKGLEWKHVFLIGLEEELLPHRRTIEGDGDIDEERRLAYVAVTRAKQALTISYARTRAKWGKVVRRSRSRFLEGLPEDAVERSEGMAVARSEEEMQAIQSAWLKKIRQDLGLAKG